MASVLARCGWVPDLVAGLAQWLKRWNGLEHCGWSAAMADLLLG
ncbi:hypothetical protein TIFTF001_048300 [Ficus carica]|uniref:Uncharacterized protein n=1 Tax=Ficus carica TaxID=3494 RepID=A0AA88CT40_FICCA|nr:hypothetical protein TIFTF001_048299 [Ficus carica]GMN33863.1 hypothetical protein TIFTF001_048300 [Ficus carica]